MGDEFADAVSLTLDFAAVGDQSADTDLPEGDSADADLLEGDSAGTDFFDEDFADVTLFFLAFFLKEVATGSANSSSWDAILFSVLFSTTEKVASMYASTNSPTIDLKIVVMNWIR